MSPGDACLLYYCRLLADTYPFLASLPYGGDWPRGDPWRLTNTEPTKLIPTAFGRIVPFAFFQSILQRLIYVNVMVIRNLLVAVRHEVL